MDASGPQCGSKAVSSAGRGWEDVRVHTGKVMARTLDGTGSRLLLLVHQESLGEL